MLNGLVIDPRKNEIRKRIRERIHNHPETAIALDLPSGNTQVRVAVYIRTGHKSFTKEVHHELDLQEHYYEELIHSRPGYKLVRFYRDYSRPNRQPHFERMLRDCKAGQIDLIITKTAARFAPNIKACMETIRMLHALKPPVGVFFETENIYTLRAFAPLTEAQPACMDESNDME